jgi:hypothetical protein
LRPTPALFADLRVNYDTVYHELRDILFGGGFARGLFSVSQSWYHTRFVATDQTTAISAADSQNLQLLRWLRCYPATRRTDPAATSPDAATVDFRDTRFTGDMLTNTNGDAISRRLINLTATAGWAWECCSMNVQRTTFNVGARNESRVIFAFTLKGIGTFGTQNIGQRRR